MLGLLRRRPVFRRFFLAHAASRAGDAFNTVALVVLAFRLTGSGTGVAGIVALEVLPVLLVGPIAGVLADRMPRRRLMVGADLGRALLAGVVAVAHDSLGVAYIAALGLATGSVLFNPAAASLLPDAVEDDELVEANTALWTAAVVVQILLAPAAGALIAFVGVGAAFAVNAASFVASALLLRTLPIGLAPADVGERARWSMITAGVAAVRAHALLVRVAVVQVLAALSAGATGGLLVVLAEERLGVGPSGFGFLLAAIGAGAATGPLLLRRWIRPGTTTWLFGPYAVRGGVDLTLAGVVNPVAAGGALFVYGTATSTGMVAYNATLQREVAPEVRSRVFAFYDVCWNGARLVSLGLGGVLADTFGVRVVYVIGGLLLLAGAAIGMVTVPATTRPRRS